MKTTVAIVALLASCKVIAGEYYVGAARATPGEAYFNFPTAKNVRNTNSPAAYLLYGGYNWSQGLGLEVGYGDFGSWTASDPTPGSKLQAQLSTSTAYVAATSSVALGSGFSLYGKLGVAANRYEDKRSSNTAMRPMVGFGGSYDVTEHLAIKLGFDYFGKMDRGTQQKVSLGLTYKF